MTQTTDSFITQAEEALAGFDRDPEDFREERQNHIDLGVALRSLLGEYKRLTAEGEVEYRDFLVAGFPRPKNVCFERQSRFVTGWVPVEGEDQ